MFYWFGLIVALVIVVVEVIARPAAAQPRNAYLISYFRVLWKDGGRTKTEGVAKDATNPV